MDKKYNATWLDHFNACCEKIIRSQNMSINITSTGQRKIQLDNIPSLRDKVILGISARGPIELPITPNGNVCVDPKHMFLTLVQNNTQEELSSIPLIEAQPSLNNGRRLVLNGMYVDFPNSYINFPNSGYTPVVGEEIFMTFFYAPITYEEYRKIQANAMLRPNFCTA